MAQRDQVYVANVAANPTCIHLANQSWVGDESSGVCLAGVPQRGS